MPAHRLRHVHIQFGFPPILRIHAGAPARARENNSRSLQLTVFMRAHQLQHPIRVPPKSSSIMPAHQLHQIQFAFPSKSNSISSIRVHSNSPSSCQRTSSIRSNSRFRPNPTRFHDAGALIPARETIRVSLQFELFASVRWKILIVLLPE